MVLMFLGAADRVQGQYSSDALRFSTTQFGSTARFKATGEAQAGIGGDISSVSGNPAGLGFFTKSEFSITPEFNNYQANSLYLNQQTVGTKDRLNINHAAIVLNVPAIRVEGSDLNQGWLNFSFGISYNRNNDFGNNIVYSGVNGTNSIADYYAELATNNYGTPPPLPSGSLERMAYDNYLISYDDSGYYFPETDVNNVQTRTETRRGSVSEVNFALGANYSNTFYIGASLGLASLNYRSDVEYKEKGYNVTEGNDYDLSNRQNQLTKGSGINGKLGIIYRPNEIVRFGATFSTPTWFSIDDSYTEKLDTKYGKTGTDSAFVNNAETYDFSYRLKTPGKLTGGIGVFISKQGFISADIDYVDYSTINFINVDNENSDVIATNNQSVANNFKSAINYRVGTEFKLDKIMLRAGYGVQGNPYKNMDNNKFKTTTYSGGLGYRVNNCYLDITYQNVQYNSDFKSYILDSGSDPVASVKNTRNSVFLTVGTRF